MQNNTGQTVDKANSYYVSGSIHTVLLKDLTPNTAYYYRLNLHYVLKWTNFTRNMACSYCLYQSLSAAAKWPPKYQCIEEDFCAGLVLL